MSDGKTIKNKSIIKKRIIQPLLVCMAIIVAFVIGLTINSGMLSEVKETKGENCNYEFNIPSPSLSNSEVVEQSNVHNKMEHASNGQANSVEEHPMRVNSSGTRPIQQMVNPISPSTGNTSRNMSNETKPSADYLRLFHSVVKDYHRSRAEWAKVKRDGFINKRGHNAIEHFTRNFKQNLYSLKNDSKNYNLLSNAQKSEIKEIEHFINDVTRNYHSYPDSPNRNSNSD